MMVIMIMMMITTMVMVFTTMVMVFTTMVMVFTTLVMMMTTIMAMMKSMCIGGERLTFQSDFKLFPLISTHTAVCTGKTTVHWCEM